MESKPTKKNKKLRRQKIALTVATFIALFVVLSVAGYYVCVWGRHSLLVICLSSACCTVLIHGSAFLVHRNSNRFIEEERKQIEYEKTRFDIIYENTSVNIWDYDFKTKEIRQTERSVNMHGHGTVVYDVPDSLVKSRYVHPSSADDFMAMYQKLFDGEERAEGVFLVQNADRSRYWYEYIRYTTLFDNEGVPYSAIGMSTDVTAEEERKIALRQWAELISGVSNDRTTIIEYNLSANQFVRRQGTLLPDLKVHDTTNLNACVNTVAHHLAHPEDISAIESFLNRDRLIAAYLDGKREDNMDYRVKLDGRYSWVNLHTKLAQYPGENAIRAIIINTDIDDRKQNELRLLSQAQNDPLTGALNRETFIKSLEEIIDLMPEATHALIMIDLDDFKGINDSLGHLAGDKVLLQTATSLRALLRSGDLVGRIGGDEFMVFLKNIPNVDVVRRRAEFINKMLVEKLSHDVVTSGSLGISLYPKDGKDFAELYKAADIAVYNSKSMGRNCYAFYSPEFEPIAGTNTGPIDSPTCICEQNETKKKHIEQIISENQKLLDKQEEDERYRIVVERTGMVTFEWNESTQKFSASAGFSDYALSTLDVSCLFSERVDISKIHPNDRALFYGKFLEKVLSGESVMQVGVRLALVNGGYRMCRLSAIVVADKDGVPQKYIGIIVAENLDNCNSKVQLDAILKFIEAGILLIEICNDHASPIYISDSFYKMENISIDTGFSGDAFHFVHPDDVAELKRKMWISAHNGEPMKHKFRVYRNGNICWRRINATRVPYTESANPVLIVLEADASDDNNSADDRRAIT